MKRKNKIITTALVATVAISSSFALWAESSKNGEHSYFSEHRIKEGWNGQKGECGRRGGEHKNRGGEHRMEGRFDGKNLEREFTADEIRTLTSAKLIRKGNPNIKVGEVKSTGNGYSVTIVTKDNSLVEELSLAKNGMDLDFYQKIQKRMEEKKQRREARETKKEG